MIVEGIDAPFPVHLTYCLNIHPGDAWQDQSDGIRSVASPIRQVLSPDTPFGLGLRLSDAAARSLISEETVRTISMSLAQEGFYVFTVNAFPYGAFHRTTVKEHVYQPDWRTRERMEYTCRVADILACFLPDSISGSISTVPCSYKPWITSYSDGDDIIRNLMHVVRHLARIESEKGRYIHLGLEPEPDCVLETTEEVVQFFSETVMTRGVEYLRGTCGCSPSSAEDLIRRHLGVCFDTCHLALQYENLVESLERLHRSGILISKIQISSALKTEFSPDSFQELQKFCDPVYLHQVKVRMPDGQVTGIRDLNDALAACRSDWFQREWRIHVHVPLYVGETTRIRTTSDELTPLFFRTAVNLGVQHFEIETYTFDVLPDRWRQLGLVHSIVLEYQWVLDRFRGA